MMGIASVLVSGGTVGNDCGLWYMGMSSLSQFLTFLSFSYRQKDVYVHMVTCFKQRNYLGILEWCSPKYKGSSPDSDEL